MKLESKFESFGEAINLVEIQTSTSLMTPKGKIFVYPFLTYISNDGIELEQIQVVRYIMFKNCSM